MHYLDNGGSGHRWGLGLDDYLESTERYTPSRRPSLDQVKESIKLFSTGELTSRLTCTVLEDVLLLLQYPEYISSYARSPSVWGKKLLDPVLSIIGGYTEQGNKIFDHYFGFLCVQILAIGIQLDVLSQHGILSKVIHARALGEVTNEAEAVSHALYQGSLKIMVRSGIRCSIVPQDLDDVLDILEESRCELFRICRTVPDIHGWDVIFVAVRNTFKTLPTLTTDFDISRNKHPIAWPLYDLNCRYALAIPHHETMTIEALVAVTEWARHKESDKVPDLETIYPGKAGVNMDVFALRDALTDCLTRSGASRLHTLVAPILAKFVVHYIHHTKCSFSASSAPFFQAVFDRLWLEIEDDRCMTDLEYRKTTLKLAAALFDAIGYPFYAVVFTRDNSKGTLGTLPGSAFFTEMLLQADWINLTGRVFLLPVMPLSGREVSEIELGNLADVYKEAKNELSVFITFLQRYGPEWAARFCTSFRDWLNVHRYIGSASLRLADGHKPLLNHYDDVRKTWGGIPQFLGWSSSARQGYCFYTGCPNVNTQEMTTPSRVCGSCLSTSAAYCSEQCQRSDYMRHYLECKPRQ
ncbi:unnamed protein product [Rhizoctonia solani]|nr:unnamed protein product [Rhizoctonia solani]